MSSNCNTKKDMVESEEGTVKNYTRTLDVC